MEQAARAQEHAVSLLLHADGHWAWVVRVRKMAHYIRARLPGVPLPDYMGENFGVEFDPLPLRPDPQYVRNLFSEAPHLRAQEQVKNHDLDVAWAAGRWLHHRGEAIGRYCYNTNCPKFPNPLQQRAGPGRPRLYCCERCKVNGVKRHQRNEADPLRPEKLRDVSRPWYVRRGWIGRARHGLRRQQPLRMRDFDHPDWTEKHRDALRLRGVPQGDEIKRLRAEVENALEPGSWLEDDNESGLEVRTRSIDSDSANGWPNSPDE